MDEIDKDGDHMSNHVASNKRGTPRRADSGNINSNVGSGFGSDKSIPIGLSNTGNMGKTDDVFWGQSSKDISKHGYMGKNNKINSIVPISAANTLSMHDNLSRQGTAQTKYDKEKERDPAVMMAAMHFRKIHELRNESGDTRFSYFCTTAEKVLDNSNSHPSFRIYYSFLKRFMIAMVIICLLGNCLLAYNKSSKWYSEKDMKFGFEKISLGNIDGMSYQSEGSYSSSIGRDNADTGRDVTLGIDLTITVFLVLFFLYQIFTSRMELRARASPISIRDYAVKVSNIQKGCTGNVSREIQKQFIRFGNVIEVVPITNYHHVLKLELDMRSVGEEIGDLKAKDQLRNHNSQAKINKLIATEQKLHSAQRRAYDTTKKDKNAGEYIVVFDTPKSRNECLSEYSKYSRWWSRPHKKMPIDMRLHAKFAYKVKEAPEPSEYILENWYFPRWINWILFILYNAIAITLCTVLLVHTVKRVESAYDDIPIYTECSKYYFDTVTASSYLTATSTNAAEVSCFCRHLGYDIVKSASGDNRKLCQYWLDLFPTYYRAFFGLMFSMLAINIFLTYFFRLVFHPSIFRVRYKTTRYILTACCVFVLQFFFLGYLPEYLMSSSIYSLGRTWYLRAGVVYTIYFLMSLALHPIESLIYWVFHMVRRRVLKSKMVIQKDLNKLYLGAELDYSHKIGRIMAHALIAFHHGVGLPVLYLFFMAQIVIFLVLEKALMLRFYRKLENQVPYIRQYLIHCLLLIIMFHCFRSIDILGSEDIFPTTYTETIGLKSGTILYYYAPDPTEYTDRMVLIQGIFYLIIAILLAVFYFLIWWSHRRNCLGKVLGCVSLLNHYPRRPIPVSTLRDRNLAFKPDTYMFSQHEKYQAALSALESEFSEESFGHGRHDSSNKSAVDSHYDLKSEGNNSGDDVLNDRKNNKEPVYNIYRQGDATKGKPNNLDSENPELEDIEDS